MKLTLVITSLLVLFGILLLLSGCSDTEVNQTTPGDRCIQKITAGRIVTPQGEARFYLVLRDPETGADYLVVQEAGIIELKPKPHRVGTAERVVDQLHAEGP